MADIEAVEFYSFERKRQEVELSPAILDLPITFNKQDEPVTIRQLMSWFSPIPTLNSFRVAFEIPSLDFLLISQLTGEQRLRLAESYCAMHGITESPSEAAVNEIFERLVRIYAAIIHKEEIVKVNQRPMSF